MSKVLFVPVFRPHSKIPEGELNLEKARLLVREGHASWINRCKAIRLLRDRFDLRGLSCRLRPDSALKSSPEIKAAIDDYLITE